MLVLFLDFVGTMKLIPQSKAIMSRSELKDILFIVYTMMEKTLSSPQK
jgi:hypothetical protein